MKLFHADGRCSGKLGGYGRLDGELKFPYGVTCDSYDHIYVADHYNNRISLFTADGAFMEHVLTSEDGISRPKALAFMGGLLYVSHGGLRANHISIYQLTNSRERRGIQSCE